ncbi:MAG: DUF6941 family protein [Myxococcota bacterium]
MPKINAVIACEGLALDAITGRVTAFNALDTIFLARLPALLQRLHVLVSYERVADSGPVQERVTILSPTGAVLARTKETELQLTLPFHNSLHAIWGLKFEEQGDLEIVVEHREGDADFREVFRRKLRAELQPHPLMPTITAPAEQSS